MSQFDSTATHSAGAEIHVYLHELAAAEVLPLSLPIPTSAKWRQLAMVKTIAHSGMNAKVCDVTHLSSPYQWREFLRGFKDAGTLQLGLWFSDYRTPTLGGFDAFGNVVSRPLGWPFLFDEFFRGPAVHKRWWDMRVPDEDGIGAHRLACWGFVTSVPQNVPDDEGIDVSLELKYVGYPVFVHSEEEDPLGLNATTVSNPGHIPTAPLNPT